MLQETCLLSGLQLHPFLLCLQFSMTPEVTPPPRPSVEAAAFAPVGPPQAAEEQKPTHEAVVIETGQLARTDHYGWRTAKGAPSLQEVNSSVRVPPLTGSWHAKLKAFAGLGFVISVGYMDPGMCRHSERQYNTTLHWRRSLGY